MRQTEKYGFNLVDTEDAFSPVPLNENTRKTEELLAAQALCSGGYTGTGAAQTVELGFRPRLLIIWGYDGSGRAAVHVMDRSGGNMINGNGLYSGVGVGLTETGFQLTTSVQNETGKTMRYCAFP